MNPYEVLNISSDSSFEDIDRSYREMAKKYHPDLNPDDPNSSKKFKEIQNAYELLKKIKKSNFQSFRYKSSSNKNKDFSFEVNDFFSKSVFKGRNVQIKLEITLFEVFTGCKKSVKVKKKKVCKSCNGSGFSDFISCESCEGKGYSQISDPPFMIKQGCKSCATTGRINIGKCVNCSGFGYSSYEDNFLDIDVPQGAEHRSQLVFSGLGEQSLKGGQNGDLIVLIFIKDHEIFKREGVNLHLDALVSYTQLVLGGEIEIPCITGEKVSLKIPSFSKPNKLRVKGKGLPGKGGIGDMIVNLKLDIPKELNKEYLECLKNLSFLEEKYISNSRKAWKEKINNRSFYEKR